MNIEKVFKDMRKRSSSISTPFSELSAYRMAGLRCTHNSSRLRGSFWSIHPARQSHKVSLVWHARSSRRIDTVHHFLTICKHNSSTSHDLLSSIQLLLLLSKPLQNLHFPILSTPFHPFHVYPPNQIKLKLLA